MTLQQSEWEIVQTRQHTIKESSSQMIKAGKRLVIPSRRVSIHGMKHFSPVHHDKAGGPCHVYWDDKLYAKEG